MPIDPAPTACIPQTELNTAAQAMLSYYPLAQHHSKLHVSELSDQFPGKLALLALSARYNRSFGAAPARGGRGGLVAAAVAEEAVVVAGQNRNAPPVLRQSIAENFSYSHSASANSSFSPLLGGSRYPTGTACPAPTPWAMDASIAPPRYSGTARAASRSTTLPTAPRMRVSRRLGIYIGNPTIYSNPFFFGVPSINISGVTDRGIRAG